MGDAEMRFSDDALLKFRAEFDEHVQSETKDREMLSHIYEALFRKEDKDTNVSPGAFQLLVQIGTRMQALEVAAVRQKTFIGGGLATLAIVGSLFTDTAHKVIGIIKGL